MTITFFTYIEDSKKSLCVFSKTKENYIIFHDYDLKLEFKLPSTYCV